MEMRLFYRFDEKRAIRLHRTVGRDALWGEVSGYGEEYGKAARLSEKFAYGDRSGKRADAPARGPASYRPRDKNKARRNPRFTGKSFTLRTLLWLRQRGQARRPP